MRELQKSNVKSINVKIPNTSLMIFNKKLLIALLAIGTVSTGYAQDSTFVSSVIDSLPLSQPISQEVASSNAVAYGFVNPSTGPDLNSFARGLLGLLSCIIIAFLFSKNRSRINWKLVASGILVQIIIGFLILNPLKLGFLSWIRTAFEFVARCFSKVISFSDAGVNFLFGTFASGQTLVDPALATFAIKVLPTVIFFSALTSVLFYLGILQKIVYGLAWILKKTMKLSGAEALAAAGNIFLGQTEAPLLIKPYIEKMTRSEIMCLMSGGMATIAGGVLAAYIGFLGGGIKSQEIFFAIHLLTASVMSAPAAIVVSKIIVPETEPFAENLQVSKEKIGSNFLDAISNGTTDGLKLAVNVGAMLLVFTALVAFLNYILQSGLGNIPLGEKSINAYIASLSGGSYDGLNLQSILGYICSPIAWLIGVPSDDMLLVGQLLGEKTAINEFYAYTQMGKIKNASGFTYEKSLIMSTYVLCGFSNFASIGIQIGGIGALAPSKRADLAALGFRAMIGGTLACLMTATIAGMFY